jgi:hypothetical protein
VTSPDGFEQWVTGCRRRYTAKHVCGESILSVGVKASGSLGASVAPIEWHERTMRVGLASSRSESTSPTVIPFSLAFKRSGWPGEYVRRVILPWSVLNFEGKQLDQVCPTEEHAARALGGFEC